jgi:hypothetical protein
MDDHYYNLVKSLSKKAQAVSKYDRYIHDASECEQCKSLWESLKEKENRQIEKIKDVLKDHVKSDKF